MRRLLPYIIALLIPLALVLAFYPRLAFTDLILARGDTFAYFYPYWAARDAALSAGNLPLWSPDIFMGVPLLANSQLGTFYPPNWISALLRLDPPNAIRVSILIHVAWAGLGAYLLARRSLQITHLSAALVGIVFAFGGHIGAHVEQINQLQGLSWMPWLFVLMSSISNVGTRHALSLRRILLLGGTLALQFFTGHTQTVFISLIGLGIYALFQPSRVRALLTLIAAGVIALILTAPQLIPTLELSGLSIRGGGLNQNEATAFSLSPFTVGRGLLPSFDTSIFGEYVAYIGVIGIGLAILGAAASTSTPVITVGRWQKWAWITIALIGLCFAFGVYNPIYWTLAGLPGFNLFRVPARWLSLFALGASMLAGLGLHHLIRGYRPRLTVTALIIGVIAAFAAGSHLALNNPDGTPASLPTMITIIGWGVALLVLLAIVILPRFGIRGWGFEFVVLVIAASLELLLANFALPHNDLAPREAWSSERFTISQMQVYAAESTPPPRMLSISNILFDPGDRAALEARYRAIGLSETAIRHAFVAIKLKEIVAPNLSLAWGIPTIDGFDGGLLPTYWYSAFTSLLLPEGSPRTVDGRLREMLAREECFGACIPDWLRFLGVRYLVLDKVYDIWYDDVGYDIGIPTRITPVFGAEYHNPYGFIADSIDVLYLTEFSNVDSPEFEGLDSISLYDVQENWMLIDIQEVNEPELITTINGQDIMRVRFPVPERIYYNRLVIDSQDFGISLAVTLVDTQTGEFQQLAPSYWTRVLSSDIKIYEHQAAGSRAQFYDLWQVFPDSYDGTEAALSELNAPNSGNTLMINTDATIPTPTEHANEPSNIEFLEYSAERIVMRVSSTASEMLLLKDAYYPGWQATIDGNLVPIYRANVMFRAVYVPSGVHEIVMKFRPDWLTPSLTVGSIAWGILVIALISLKRATFRKRN